MTREEKNQIIDSLTKQLTESRHFYLADTSGINAETTSALRRKCYENKVELIVVKNTLLKKALERCGTNFDALFPILKKSTSIMFCENATAPAKLIKDFRKGSDKPAFKAAFVQDTFFIGEKELDSLTTLKSKEDLIGDIILMLQSPLQNVLGALQSGGNTITGVLETLKKKEE